MKIKNNKKIIILSLLVLFAVAILTTVEAATTADDGELTTSYTAGTAVGSFLMDILGDLGGFAISGMFSYITPLIGALTVVILLTLEALFKVGVGEWSSPMPDALVFNKVPALDANFVNPHNNSLLNTMGGSFIGQIFVSFQTIGIALFIIAAMVTGIKIALSTIAAKKAQYKQVAMKWLTGFIVLLCLRWIIAAIFLANETLVSALADIASSDGFGVYVDPVLPIPWIGKLLDQLIDGVAGVFGIPTEYEVAGYYGLILFSLFEGFKGDIVASIIGFVITGQATVVLASYIKRIFMCLLLGIVAPLIVSVDTVVAVSGGQSQIFKTWLKNFIFTVCTQSFHAAYMVVVFRFINNITSSSISSTLGSIVIVALTTGLIKMEKMLKGMFGFGDSMSGTLADGNKSMKKAMGAVAGLAAAAKSLGDNKPKEMAAGKRVQAYSAEKERLKANIRNGSSGAVGGTGGSGGTGGGTKSTSNITGGNVVNNIQNMGVPGMGQGGDGSVGGNGNKVVTKEDYLQSLVNNKGNVANMTDEEKIDMLTQAEAEARSEQKSAKLARIMGVANLAAGVGMGIGMGDDIGEALFKGGIITSGLDKITEGVGRKAADRDRKALYDREVADATDESGNQRYKITDTKRQKTEIEAVLTFDVARMNKEFNSQMNGLGEVFGNQVKNQVKNAIKEVESDVSNEK